MNSVDLKIIQNVSLPAKVEKIYGMHKVMGLQLFWSGTPTFSSGTPTFCQMGVLNSCFQNPSESSVNCQSIRNKKAELHTIIDSAKPDIILGNESWLTPDIKNSEIFPESFDAVRKDRASDAHGGVFIAFKCDLLCTETPELDTNCEIVWCKMNIIGCRTLYLGSFYRPP